MFGLTSTHHYEYYAKPCDMRKGFDTLCGLVRSELGRDPTNGEVFIFVNKPRNTIKLLHWERGGLVIYHKRLEKGTFTLPKIAANATQIHWPDLVLMLEGITIKSMLQKPRFCLENNSK